MHLVAPRRQVRFHGEPNPAIEPNSLAQFARLPVVVAAASAAGGELGRDFDVRFTAAAAAPRTIVHGGGGFFRELC
jgi:hypothetical protein